LDSTIADAHHSTVLSLILEVPHSDRLFELFLAGLLHQLLLRADKLFILGENTASLVSLRDRVYLLAGEVGKFIR